MRGVDVKTISWYKSQKACAPKSSLPSIDSTRGAHNGSRFRRYRVSISAVAKLNRTLQAGLENVVGAVLRSWYASTWTPCERCQAKGFPHVHGAQGSG